MQFRWLQTVVLPMQYMASRLNLKPVPKSPVLTHSTIPLQHLPTTMHNHNIVHQKIVTLTYQSYQLVAKRYARFKICCKKQTRSNREIRRILQGLLSPRRMPNPAPQP